MNLCGMNGTWVTGLTVQLLYSRNCKRNFSVDECDCNNFTKYCQVCGDQLGHECT